MSSFEPKKLALLRIWQILKENSDYDHPLTQEEIGDILDRDYGITLERKAVGRNIAMLQEADIEIGSRRNGSYLISREFDDAELRMLIDGVLSSKHITAKQSEDLIRRLSAQSSKFFKSHVKNVYSVNDWSKTDNQALFYNIEVVDQAIDRKLMISYDYNKYGMDKKLHRSAYQRISPYQMILHNQRYYVMGYSDFFGSMVFHRLDHISNIQIREDKPAIDIRSVRGYEKGLDYKRISSTMPYFFADTPVRVTMTADKSIVDQIIEWFGKDVRIAEVDEKHVEVVLSASPTAMKYWALQYLDHVEVTAPESLRKAIRESLERGKEKYN